MDHAITIQFRIEFFLEMPASWSKKKRELFNGSPHQAKPDIDNLLKAFMDCLAENDSFVFKVTMAKYWATQGHIRVWQNKNLERIQ